MKKLIISAMAFSLALASCGSNESKKSNHVVTTNNTEPETVKESVDNSTEVQKSDNEKSESSTISSSSNNYDAMLTSYEDYIDSYIGAMKKVKAGDMSLMAEYPALLEKAQDLDEKLKATEGELNKEQMKRYIKLQTKLSNAMVDLM